MRRPEQRKTEGVVGWCWLEVLYGKWGWFAIFACIPWLTYAILSPVKHNKLGITIGINQESKKMFNKMFHNKNNKMSSRGGV